MAKFQTVNEYHEWCEDMVSKIYYANIAMNNEAIRDVVAKIASVLHVMEGDDLIAPIDSRYTRL
jgi:hypothetical protein